jgi:hypothetical protein
MNKIYTPGHDQCKYIQDLKIIQMNILEHNCLQVSHAI